MDKESKKTDAERLADRERFYKKQEERSKTQDHIAEEIIRQADVIAQEAIAQKMLSPGSGYIKICWDGGSKIHHTMFTTGIVNPEQKKFENMKGKYK